MSNNINKFSPAKAEEKTLSTLLNLLIPPSTTYKKPGGSEVNFFTYMHEKNNFNLVQDILLKIKDEANKVHGQDFSMLTASDQAHIVKLIQRNNFHSFTRLINEIIQCYYQNDKVLESIGLEPRPPFPDGYYVDEGDLTLLIPVFERGKIYRDIDRD